MVVRLMGEGQYRVRDELLVRLNAIDEQAVEALDRGDENELRAWLQELVELVRQEGERLPDTHLAPSDLIVPPSDLSLDEGRRLMTSDGLIPDLLPTV